MKTFRDFATSAWCGVLFLGTLAVFGCGLLIPMLAWPTENDASPTRSASNSSTPGSAPQVAETPRDELERPSAGVGAIGTVSGFTFATPVGPRHDELSFSGPLMAIRSLHDGDPAWKCPRCGSLAPIVQDLKVYARASYARASFEVVFNGCNECLVEALRSVPPKWLPPAFSGQVFGSSPVNVAPDGSRWIFLEDGWCYVCSSSNRKPAGVPEKR